MIDPSRDLKMTTEPRIKRLASLALASVAAALVVILLTVEHAKNSDFRKAAEWHKVHGDVIAVDGHKLTLPKDWWEKDPQGGGQRVVLKATRSLLKTWQTGIILARKGPNEAEEDEDGIRKHLETFIEIENKGKQTPISSLVVLNAASTRIYCKNAVIVEPMVELRCDVVGAPTLITSIGLPNTVEDVERIISTFE
jgi:hypothetical protein